MMTGGPAGTDRSVEKNDRSREISVDLFRNMLDNLAPAGMIVDVDRTIKYCNRNAEKIFGYSSDELLGRRTELLYGDRRKDPSNKTEIYDELERTGFHKGVARGLRKDGRAMKLELFTFVIKPKKGAIIFVRMEEDASAGDVDKAMLLQNLLDTIPDMIYFKDLENRFIAVNKAHADALGLSPEQIIGKRDLDLFPRELGEKYDADDREIIETGTPIIGEIEKAPRPDGGMTYVSTTKVPNYDKEGRIVGIIGITRNITDKMIAEEELRKYKDNLEGMVKDRTKELEENNMRLQRMYNMKSDFISVVSHELRTPLTILKEGIEMVADGTLGEINDDQKFGLNTALKNIDRLARLIDDILDLSKLERKKMQFIVEKANLNEIVHQVAESYRSALEKKGLRLDVDLDALLPLVKLDSDRVVQVVHNLMSNAMKFTAGGKIVISTSFDKENVKVSVTDTGCGIRNEDLAKVFGKFEQITSNPITRQVGGTGLGLAICKQIIEQMNGTIGVESVYGKGTTFYFTLPIKG